LETNVLISPAFAQGAPGAGPGYEQFFIIIGMFALLYFLMIRPQMKRSKEHKQMTEALQKGDEVITSGGVLGENHQDRRDLRVDRDRAQHRGAAPEERDPDAAAKGTIKSL